jgi:NAD(P)-dependent dehydrogenase (short-subunit alcohol dehydrogenase family)
LEVTVTQACADRVVIVTGAGRGIGRCHALELARQGACVVVNDLGTSATGSGASDTPAQTVVAEIEEFGGSAIANTDDVSDWAGAGQLLAAAIDRWGRLDGVVNNAGILRDRMFVSATVDEWDAVMRVHLRGHFCVTRHATAYWRAETKAGRLVDARIINTSSGAGLLGSIGQSAYAAAKAGITALTLVQAAELGRYGITANALAPAARTRMTETAFAEMMRAPDKGFDKMAPENISPLVAWLASEDSADVTGRIFEIAGGEISIANGWRRGVVQDKGARWDANELGPIVRGLIANAPEPERVYGT